MPLRLERMPVGELDDRAKARMFELLEQSFEGVCRVAFLADLAEKDTVLLLVDAASGRIAGFSTLMRFRVGTPRGEVMVVFSGDTAVEESARNSWGFGYGLDAYFREARQEAGRTPVYYVLISKGWRTYRVLAFLFRAFFPAPAGGPDAHGSELVRAFGAYNYPDRFDARRGLVIGRPDGPRIRRGGPDALVANRLADPHVRFFAAANPRHDQGDELVCVADVSPRNYTAAFERMLRRQTGCVAWEP